MMMRADVIIQAVHVGAIEVRDPAAFRAADMEMTVTGAFGIRVLKQRRFSVFSRETFQFLLFAQPVQGTVDCGRIKENAFFTQNRVDIFRGIGLIRMILKKPEYLLLSECIVMGTHFLLLRK